MTRSRPSPRWVWLWLLVAWLPVGALFLAMMLTVHTDASIATGIIVALRLIVAAALLAPLVYRLAARLPWPRPFRPSFLLAHLVAGLLWSAAWVLLNSVLTSLQYRQPVLVVGVGIVPFLVMGVWLYLIVAGVAYAIRASERAARAEAVAAQSHLAPCGAAHPAFRSTRCTPWCQ